MDRTSEEIKRRIKLCIAAYAYEIKNDSIMPDTTFDEECKKVDVTITTGNDKIDNFFKTHFDPCTGQWIHNHPEQERLKELYTRYYKQ